MILHTAMIGTDFKKAAVTVRERIFFDERKRLAFLSMVLRPGSCVKEAVVFSTCNRMEVYVMTDNVAEAKALILDALAEIHQVERIMLSAVMYAFRCEEAVLHLFRVASGLESMVLGENEILGQVREAYQKCAEAGSVQRGLKRLFEKSIQIGKFVRTRTAINEGSYSVSSVSFDLMLQKTEQYRHKKMLIIGTSKMGVGFIEKSRKHHLNDITIVNRTEAKAQELSERYHCKTFAFDELNARFRDYNVIYAATGAKSYILTNNDSKDGGGSKEPILILDVGVPRNVDPELGKRDEITLISIDDLKSITQHNLQKRQQEVASVEEIIERGAHDFYTWYREKQHLWMAQSA